jgi:hypothetical protein
MGTKGLVDARPGKRCRRPMIGTSNALPPQSKFVVGMPWPLAKAHGPAARGDLLFRKSGLLLGFVFS